MKFWDLHDGRNWLNDFPWKYTEHPLLFDCEHKPKPAFEVVLAVEQERFPPRGDERQRRWLREWRWCSAGGPLRRR